MAATVGKLSIQVQANTSRFSRGMQKASMRVKAFAKRVASSARGVAMFGSALAAAGVAGLGAVVNKTLKAMDSTTKLADAIGIATEDLTAFQHAANITGVSTEGLNKGMKDFVRRLGEAKSGTGDAKNALEKLGLNVDELIASGPAEAFKRVAESTNELGSQAEKAEVAYRLFGRQGVNLVNTLRLGRDGLDEMKNEAKGMGLTFSREAGAKAEMFNDSMTRLMGVIKGAAQIIAVEMAPVLTMITDKFTASGMSGGGMGAKVVGAFEKIVKAIAKVAGFMDLIKSGFLTLQVVATTAIRGIVWIVGKLVDALSWVLEKIGVQIPQGVKNFIDVMDDELQVSIKKTKKDADEFYKSFASGDRVRKVEKWFADIRKASDAAAAKIAQDAKSTQGVLAAPIEAARAKGPSEFRQLVRSRTAFGATKQRVPIIGDPQQTELLSQIVQALTSPLGRAA